MSLSRKVFGGIAALALSASAAVAQEVTLRFQFFTGPKSAVPAYFMYPWAEKIMEDSGGRLKIELSPGMQLGGKPPALYDQIRDGVIVRMGASRLYTRPLS